MPKEVWSDEQIQYLFNNLETKTFKEIGEAISKSELAVQLYVHRQRIPVGSRVIRNMIIEILKIKFVNPSYFQPNKDFYKAVGLTQKRWWDLYYGRAAVKEAEYISLCDHFQVTLQQAFEARQLNLFDQTEE